MTGPTPQRCTGFGDCDCPQCYPEEDDVVIYTEPIGPNCPFGHPWNAVKRIEELGAALRARDQQLADVREALEVIAAEDDLVVANEDVFSVHAYRRCRRTAQWALASLAGADGGEESADG